MLLDLGFSQTDAWWQCRADGLASGVGHDATPAAHGVDNDVDDQQELSIEEKMKLRVLTRVFPDAIWIVGVNLEQCVSRNEDFMQSFQETLSAHVAKSH